MTNEDFVKSYLSRFSYNDWSYGDDAVLRIGDHMIIDFQHYSEVSIEKYLPARLDVHPDLGLPCLIVNEEFGYSEDSGEYISLEQTYLDGYEVSRISKDEFIKEMMGDGICSEQKP